MWQLLSHEVFENFWFLKIFSFCNKCWWRNQLCIKALLTYFCTQRFHWKNNVYCWILEFNIQVISFCVVFLQNFQKSKLFSAFFSRFKRSSHLKRQRCEFFPTFIFIPFSPLKEDFVSDWTAISTFCTVFEAHNVCMTISCVFVVVIHCPNFFPSCKYKINHSHVQRALRLKSNL